MEPGVTESIPLGNDPNYVLNVYELVGKGGFGRIHRCRFKDLQLALKREPRHHKSGALKKEMEVLCACQGMPHFPKIYHYGTMKEEYFVTMELLGRNLGSLVRKQPRCVFTPVTVALLGLQSLEAIELLHSKGYLHCDVKPSNFVIGRNHRKRTLYLIDFGLSRRFYPIDEQSQTGSHGFRGTARYASVSTHLGKEQGRIDDLWSWFYMLVDLSTNNLPWGLEQDKTVILQKKQDFSCSALSELPLQYTRIFQVLSTLSCYDQPNYNIFKQSLLHVLEVFHSSYSASFDWNPSDVFNPASWNLIDNNATKMIQRNIREMQIASLSQNDLKSDSDNPNSQSPQISRYLTLEQGLMPSTRNTSSIDRRSPDTNVHAALSAGPSAFSPHSSVQPEPFTGDLNFNLKTPELDLHSSNTEEDVFPNHNRPSPMVNVPPTNQANSSPFSVQYLDPTGKPEHIHQTTSNCAPSSTFLEISVDQPMITNAPSCFVFTSLTIGTATSRRSSIGSQNTFTYADLSLLTADGNMGSNFDHAEGTVSNCATVHPSTQLQGYYSTINVAVTSRQRGLSPISGTPSVNLTDMAPVSPRQVLVRRSSVSSSLRSGRQSPISKPPLHPSRSFTIQPGKMLTRQPSGSVQQNPQPTHTDAATNASSTFTSSVVPGQTTAGQLAHRSGTSPIKPVVNDLHSLPIHQRTASQPVMPGSLERVRHKHTPSQPTTTLDHHASRALSSLWGPSLPPPTSLTSYRSQSTNVSPRPLLYTYRTDSFDVEPHDSFLETDTKNSSHSSSQHEHHKSRIMLDTVEDVEPNYRSPPPSESTACGCILF
ncbi:putative Tau-tubulin kinase 1 [Blattamonas nauphoetae]|uniref:non-specific serine/threonine protein kinase n=1 Tax=Blattamonas nauphoetae TaxID=2049346 RepID=A0ABQ9XLC4_9EUKA|nr:putative Tau-tubulin kinase 1 [Blattamonas nauphoetae]